MRGRLHVSTTSAREGATSSPLSRNSMLISIRDMRPYQTTGDISYARAARFRRL